MQATGENAAEVLDPAGSRPAVNPTVAIRTLLIAAFVVILNETLMAVATPKIMASFGIGAGVAQWVSTAFMLTMGVVIPISGFLIQRFHTRTLFQGGLGLFCLGTLLAGIAPLFPLLVLGRVVQACGTAIMMPLLMTTILALIPLERRGAAMGNVTVVIAVAPALGPTISGLIVQHFTWRFLFLFVLPIALSVLFYGRRTLMNVTEPRHAKLDIASVILSALAFGGIVFGFTNAGEGGGGWGSPLVIAPLAVGLSAFVIFARRQLVLPQPVLNLRAFSYPAFALSAAIVGAVMALLFSTIILLPLFLQSAHGMTPLRTGMLMLPGGVMLGMSAPLVGRAFDRWGPGVLATSGSLSLMTALWMLTRITPVTPLVQIIAMHCALTLGVSLLMTPVQTTGLNHLPRPLHPHGTAIIGTLQQVSGAVGTALLVTVMTSQTRIALAGVTVSAAAAAASATSEMRMAALAHGFQSAFTVSALLSTVPLALVLWLVLHLKRTPAPETESRPALSGH